MEHSDTSSLVDRLLQRLPVPPAGVGQVAAAALDRRLRVILAEAQACWPGVILTDEAFIDYLAERLPTDGPPEEALGRVQAADLYLACACLGGVPRAVVAFEQLCGSAMSSALARFDLGASEREDLKQQLRTKLLVAEAGRVAKIAQYAGRGPLGAWVGVVAAREALQLLRRPRREVLVNHSDDVVDLLLEQVGPGDAEIEQLRRTYRSEFKQAFQQATAALEPRQRNLLRYRYLDDLNIDQIGVIYRIHRATVARQLNSVRTHLLDRVRETLMQRLRISQQTFASITRLLDTNFEVSLPRILGGPGNAAEGEGTLARSTH